MARAREKVVPWAEIVANAPFPMSSEDLGRLPEDGWIYELVEGQLVRMAPAGGGHGSLTSDLHLALGAHVKAYHLGQVLAAETGFILTDPRSPMPTELAADVAFVRSERLPRRDSAAWHEVWQLAPDLVVEVASPTQRRYELAEKARLWLRHGVRLVWVVWPKIREVDVWSKDGSEADQTLRVGDVLTGRDVVPGFSYPLADLFA